MKIAFCLITNRSNRLKRMAFSMNYAITEKTKYQLCISYQKPVNHWIIENVGAFLPKQIDVVAEPRVSRSKIFNATQARLHAFSLASSADYLLMIDDDFCFCSGTQCFPWSSGERIMDCVQYLEENKSCGVVYLKGYLGGFHYQRKIVPMNGGFYETGLGILVRGKTRPYDDIINSRFFALGIGEDVSIGITSIYHGYYVAKAFNCITRKDHTKKVLIPKGKSTINQATQIEYDYDYMTTKGVFSQIIKTFGSFQHGKPLTNDIINHYRKVAQQLGNEVVY